MRKILLFFFVSSLRIYGPIMKRELFSNWDVLWSSNRYKDLLDTPSDNDKEEVDFEPLVAVLQKEKTEILERKEVAEEIQKDEKEGTKEVATSTEKIGEKN